MAREVETNRKFTTHFNIKMKRRLLKKDKYPYTQIILFSQFSVYFTASATLVRCFH